MLSHDRLVVAGDDDEECRQALEDDGAVQRSCGGYRTRVAYQRSAGANTVDTGAVKLHGCSAE